MNDREREYVIKLEREMAELKQQRDELRGLHTKIGSKAADLIEQQAATIKELEAERDAERDNCVAVIATYQEQLAALRQRIADAPVVAWLHEVRRDSDVITDQVKHLWGRVPVAVGKEAHYTIPLISKEGLK